MRFGKSREIQVLSETQMAEEVEKDLMESGTGENLFRARVWVRDFRKSREREWEELRIVI